jgi:methionyl-tRNA synthetase
MLSKFHSEFREWFHSKKNMWRKTVYPYVDSLTKESLHDRAISRDLDWGIDVPLAEAKGKKLYVWFDAPIGYVSNTKEYFKQSGRSDDYIKDWWANSEVELSNFIGKDNIIFHTIIFPVMSMASGRVKPVDEVPANQYVNLEGKQFSKSTGWYVDARNALEKVGQDALRYYLISIVPESSDSSFSWEHCQAKVNGELANNIGNFMNRCLKFYQKNWAEGVDKTLFTAFCDSEEGKKLSSDIKEFNELVDHFEIKKGLEKLMSIGSDANNYFSDRAPWAQIKEDQNVAAATLAGTVQYAIVLGSLLSSYLPTLSEKILTFFDSVLDESLKQEIYKGELCGLSHRLTEQGLVINGKVKALVPKIEDEVIKSLLEELKTKVSE